MRDAVIDSSHIRLQFRRLIRHTHAAANKDQISLLDMAHCLRIWVDMKAAVDAYLQANGIQLEWPNPDRGSTKQLTKAYRGSYYFHVSLPTGVKTSEGQMKSLTWSDKGMTLEEAKQRSAAGPPQSVSTQRTFCEWLGSAIVWVTRDPGGKHPVISINREKLICRVANLLGASHPEGSESPPEGEKDIDSWVRELDDYMVLGFPLPHLQLLEIAQTIDDKLAPHLNM